MSHAKTEIVVDGLQIAEAPRWHKDRLWLCDVTGGQVFAVSPPDDYASELVCSTIPYPCGLGFLPDGTPLVVETRGRKLWRLDPAGPTLHADLAPFAPGGMCNDMIVRPDGFAYVDVIEDDFFADPDVANGIDPSADVDPSTNADITARNDKLVLVTPDGHARVVADGLSWPNGMALSTDGGLLVLAEPGKQVLTAFDVQPDGSLTGRRLFANVAPGVPDGICLDAEGAVWMGSVYESEFQRIREGGEVLQRIPFPGKYTIACALGGADRRTLYMTTAEPNDPELFRTGKAVARVHALRIDVPGVGLP